MSLKEFSDKINTLAQDGRIGVSHRIELFDEGKEVGLNRGAIDKMIDLALKLAKEAKSNKNKQETINSLGVPIEPPTVADDPQSVRDEVNQFQKETENLLNDLSANSSGSVEFKEALDKTEETIAEAYTHAHEIIDEAEQPEEEVGQPATIFDSFEREFEYPIDDTRDSSEYEALEPLPSFSSDQESAEENALESILQEIKQEADSRRSVEGMSFEDAISATEVKFEKETEENWVPEYEGEQKDEGSFIQNKGDLGSALPQGFLALIAGGLSIITCTTMVGIFSAMVGIYLHRVGTKKIKEKGMSYYIKLHQNFLKIGIVLAWIGVGLAILFRFSLRYL